MSESKPFNIPKELIMKAYRLVKANAGAEGVDQQTLELFDKNLKDNLYKLWNRMSSGSYFPPPVKAVAIPKKSGGERILGIPTVSDRIAQAVVKLMFEARVEIYFLNDSYGYRPNKSAIDAIAITRQRCWKYDWVLEYDIKGLFDNIPHDKLMQAVHKHTKCKWVILYIERWLTAPVLTTDGQIKERRKGTPQGGVISPVLSNLYLHYVIDKWLQKHHSEKEWCRYADDGLVHCKTKLQALKTREELKVRLEECGLEMHPEKTHIVYCKDNKRRGHYTNTEFEFLGYQFRARKCMDKMGNTFSGFNPAASKTSLKAMRAKTKERDWQRHTDLSLQEIAKQYNPVIQGWLNYYGQFYRAELYKVWRHFNCKLVKWAMRKYKPLHGRKSKAAAFMRQIAKENPSLFAHWKAGMVGSFV